MANQIPIWQAENKNGKLNILDKDLFEMFLVTLPDRVQVIVQRHRKQRSGQQNKYLWGCVYPMISEHTGYSIDEVHDICKLKFNKKVVSVGKDEITIGVSTATLTTVDFKEYISKIVIWASQELSIYIPEPSQECETWK